jgi:DNA-binding beta-propeller fold protein YncE
MAAFVTRTLDQSLKRGSRRAELGMWWRDDSRLYGPLAVLPAGIKSDGQDLWVADLSGGNVYRVRASDGKPLETWTGAGAAYRVLVARGYIFVTELDTVSSRGRICRIDPSLPAGPVTTIESSLPGASYGITSDGRRLWVTQAGVGSVSVVMIDGGISFTVSADLVQPVGIIFDGKDIWVTDYGDGKLKRLDVNDGHVIQAVAVGANPGFPAFDGTNIWVPNGMSNTVTVVRAATGAVLATLSANNLSTPTEAAFDGERVLVTNDSGTRPSMWKATDLSPIEITDGTSRQGFVCSDGVNFWMTKASGELWRY